MEYEMFGDKDKFAEVEENLIRFGYNKYGTETLYSGTNGNLMNVNIYMGVVYYQRLKHMVKDKSQA